MILVIVTSLSIGILLGKILADNKWKANADEIVSWGGKYKVLHIDEHDKYLLWKLKNENF